MKHLEGVHLIKEQPVVATVGVFDGLHLGHRALVERLKDRAKALGGRSVLITFWPHPRHLLSGTSEPPLLTTLEEKVEKLTEMGLDYLLTLPFDATFSALDKDSFIEEVLLGGIGVRHLIIGPNHRFGQGGRGTFEDLKARAGKNFSVEAFEPQLIDGKVISSTKIRTALISTQLEEANRYLGYPYVFSGKVQRGEQLGRKIGFPTANLQLSSPYKLLPAAGVYAVEAQLQQRWHNAMLYIGRKSLHSLEKKTIEVNIFDTKADLYGSTLRLRLWAYLRAEQELPTRLALKQQLTKDKAQAIQLLRKIGTGT